MHATQHFTLRIDRITLECPITGKVFGAYSSTTHPACEGYGGLALWVREDTGEPIGVVGYGFWRAFVVLKAGIAPQPPKQATEGGR